MLFALSTSLETVLCDLTTELLDYGYICFFNIRFFFGGVALFVLQMLDLILIVRKKLKDRDGSQNPNKLLSKMCAAC